MSEGDFSECERRIWHHVTSPPRDHYREIAADLFQVSPDAVTKEQRALVKERFWFWLYSAPGAELEVSNDDDLRKTMEDAFRRLSEGLARDFLCEREEEVPAVPETPTGRLVRRGPEPQT